MEITFDITEAETDIIAAQYAFDGKTDRDEFVLEQFKKFGRDCILSYKNIAISSDAEVAKKAEIDSAKTAISF